MRKLYSMFRACEGAMAAFWVYDRRSSGYYATIHKGSCPFCNSGKGTDKPKADNLCGSWRGPFENYKIARTFAEGLRRSVRDCSVCKGTFGH